MARCLKTIKRIHINIYPILILFSSYSINIFYIQSYFFTLNIQNDPYFIIRTWIKKTCLIFSRNILNINKHCTYDRMYNL